MNELKHALRQLVLRPGLSATVIVMLALGIGATTAIFSLFYEVLMQPLPVPDPGRLVSLSVPGPKPGGARTGLAVSDYQAAFSYPMFRDLEARQDVFTGLAAHYDFLANLGSGEQATFGRGVLVSGHYFDVLNVTPALGRLIGPQDEPTVGEARVAVLSYDYWQRQFGADPSVINRTVAVNGQTLTIVGVAPPGFEGAMLGWRPEVYVPLTMRWLMQPEEPRNDERRFSYWLFLFGRLRPDLSVEQATAAMNVLFRGITAEIEVPLIPPNATDAQKKQFLESRLVLEPGGRGQSNVPGQAGAPLTLLLGVTSLVLLIVCVNIANLLLARGAARAGELAIRTSVGASRARLVTQLLAESAVLAMIGALLSLPVAAVTLRLIASAFPAGARLDIELSVPAMLFTAAAALATVLLFGLAPALQATRLDLAPLIKGQGAGSQGGRGVARFSRILITAQIAFATVLLGLAGLFTQSLINVARIDLGMDVESVASFSVSPLLSGYEKEGLDAIYDRVQTELASQPGVVSVATGALPMLGNFSLGAAVQVVGSDEVQGNNGSEGNLMVSSKLFETLSIPLRAGRDFTEADRSGPAVTIVNEAFVRKFALGKDAVGKRLRFRGAYVPGEAEIVGVAADARFSRVKGDVPPQFFTPRPLGDQSFSSLFFFVRSGLDADRLMSMIPRVVASVDPNLPVGNLTTMARLVRTNVYLDRIVTILSTTLAGLATLLAAIGLYGVLSYNVAQRTREIGLRLALGAEPFALRVMVLKQVASIAVIGTSLGLAAAIGLGRVAQALLYGLSAYDPLALGAAVVVLVAVVLCAAYVPARRASSVAPLEALRYE